MPDNERYTSPCGLHTRYKDFVASHIEVWGEQGLDYMNLFEETWLVHFPTTHLPATVRDASIDSVKFAISEVTEEGEKTGIIEHKIEFRCRDTTAFAIKRDRTMKFILNDDPSLEVPDDTVEAILGDFAEIEANGGMTRPLGNDASVPFRLATAAGPLPAVYELTQL